MKNSFTFNFCGIDEKCRLCNDDDCMGYGMCPILRAKAEEYAAENGALAVAVLKTKEADMIDVITTPTDKSILFVFDFAEFEYEEDYHVSDKCEASQAGICSGKCYKCKKYSNFKPIDG